MTAEEYKKKEALLATAVDAYLRDKNQKISPLARQFGVDRKALKRRIDGLPSRSNRQHGGMRLSSDQEKALIWWIETLDNLGAPPTTQQIVKNANLMLSKEDPEAAVGKNWVYRFLKRLPPQFSRIIQKPIDLERSASAHYGIIERWFLELSTTLKTLNITPNNMWNVDETGFIIGRGKQEAVVTAYVRTAKNIACDSSRESITLIECINAEGKVIPPLIIPKGTRHMEEWYSHIKEDNYLFAPSQNGFITDEIAYEWIQHFNLFTGPTKDWRLLYLDNHISHLTIEFIQYCQDQHIQIVAFPAHCTHLIQPLDGIPFQQYKNIHR
jgi:hypothetical protein